jgi:NADPH-dependent ferric siderophore reductase
MTAPDDEAPHVRLRREPPAFRTVEVRRVEDRTPRLRRLTLAGPELAGLPPGLPAASVRLLLPRGDAVELPRWEGNEFRYADGTRPAIRTLTPRRTATDGNDPELDVEVVLHGAGSLSSWTATVEPGAPVAVAGTGRGYALEPDARELVLAGDETALPAISVLLEALPTEVSVRVLVELAEPNGRLELPVHPGASVTWLDLAAGDRPGDALVPAVQALTLGADARVWAAGEAAAMQRLRRHLFDGLGLPRSRAVVRGYWKGGEEADPAT